MTDIQSAVKELREMSCPSEDDYGKLEEVARYLKGRPRFRILYNSQKKPQGIEVRMDTDFAGCQQSRKSAPGGIIRHGHRNVKSWSTSQAVVALSSGWAEYYGVLKGASGAIGVNEFCRELGV